MQPPADALRRMFETVSTRASLPAEHGRFVKPLEPTGFEALTGLAIVAAPRRIDETSGKPVTKKNHGGSPGAAPSEAAIKAAEQNERRLEREQAAIARKRKAAVKKAEAELADAVRAEHRARFEWERAKKNVEAVDRALAQLLSRED
jgi:hypothetical protein